MIVDILNGKRKKYISPFPMLFMALTLYILIIGLFNASLADIVVDDPPELPAGASPDEILDYQTSHFFDRAHQLFSFGLLLATNGTGQSATYIQTR